MTEEKRCSDCGKVVNMLLKGKCKKCYEHEIYWSNPQRREQIKIKAKKYFKNKCTSNPTWNAMRQREYRKNNPERFNRLMAMCYLRRLSKEALEEIYIKIRREKDAVHTEGQPQEV